jgi:ketosteroid isomerase-like protein
MDSDELPTERVRELFEAFIGGDLDQFLAGCAPDLVLTVRGSGSMTTLVAKGDIASWYRSMHDLTGGSLRSEVFLEVTEGAAQVVLLRHSLRRGRVEYRYETVNRCTWRHDGLVSWFSHPLRSADYARAWGLAEERVPA